MPSYSYVAVQSLSLVFGKLQLFLNALHYNVHFTAVLFFICLSVSGLSAYHRFCIVGILNSLLYKYCKEMEDSSGLENEMRVIFIIF